MCLLLCIALSVRTFPGFFAVISKSCFKGVTIRTPTKQPLVHNLSFAVPLGSSLLLTGHNGAGKSSIFRCLGGLWQTLGGTIKKPGNGDSGLHHDVFYIPQKPYNVVGHLRDQLTYPSHECSVTTERMVEVLSKVCCNSREW